LGRQFGNFACDREQSFCLAFLVLFDCLGLVGDSQLAQVLDLVRTADLLQVVQFD